MGARRRYVFDTNTIVSAFLFEQSKPGRALRYALGRGEILTSTELVEELSEVLRRSKFDRYIHKRTRENLLRAFVQETVPIAIKERVRICRDPKDDKLLEVALSGGATCIVTGDSDLLVLNPFRGIPILSAAQFLARVEPAAGSRRSGDIEVDR